MTKEDVLESLDLNNAEPYYTTKEVMTAMDEYAKQQSLAYGQFITGILKSKIPEWINGIDSPVPELSYETFLIHQEEELKKQ